MENQGKYLHGSYVDHIDCCSFGIYLWYLWTKRWSKPTILKTEQNVYVMSGSSCQFSEWSISMYQHTLESTPVLHGIQFTCDYKTFEYFDYLFRTTLDYLFDYLFKLFDNFIAQKQMDEQNKMCLDIANHTVLHWKVSMYSTVFFWLVFC